ncbi:MAG: ATP-binding protein, partial [Acidobacteriota bacterium]
RIPNSLLIFGPRGVGKKETALVLAKAMNCLNGHQDSCERCSVCRAINEKKYPDVMEIFPQGDVIKIEDIRTLKKIAYFKPMSGRKRLFIIEQAEKMRDEAANTLLKVLEEPPDFSHIILLTTTIHLILPTIKSRCQMVSFSSVPREAIHKYLLEKGLEKEKAWLISLLVRGNFKKAIDFDWDEAQALREKSWNLFHSLITRSDLSSNLKSFWVSRNKLREDFEAVLGIMASFYRDLLVIKENGENKLLINFDYQEKLKKVTAKFTRKTLMEELSWIDEALEGIERNLNPQIIVHTFFSHFTRI